MPSVTLPTLAYAALGASAIGTGVAIMGQQSQAKAASQAANYNAQVQERDSQVAQQNAKLSSEAGTQQVEAYELKARAQAGDIKANQGASGVDVNSGSFQQVRQSQDELSQVDALTIRSNATKEAYGYETQAQGYTAQSSLDTAEGKNAITAGNYASAGTLLSGIGNAASTYQSFKMSGALNSTDSDLINVTPKSGYFS